MTDAGVILKRLKKSAFQAIFLQNCTNFNIPLYPCHAKPHEKRISHCPDTFSSIRLTFFQNQWRLLPLRSKVRHFSFHKLIGWSLEILNLCTVLKNHEPVHVKHRKCIFVLLGEYSGMGTTNLNLMMQKGSRVVQIIITHKIFHIFYIFKR